MDVKDVSARGAIQKFGMCTFTTCETHVVSTPVLFCRQLRCHQNATSLAQLFFVIASSGLPRPSTDITQKFWQQLCNASAHGKDHDLVIDLLDRELFQGRIQ